MTDIGYLVFFGSIGLILLLAEVLHEMQELAYYKRRAREAREQRDRIIKNIAEGRYSLNQKAKLSS